MNNPAQSIAETLFPALCKAVAGNPDGVTVSVRHGSASSEVTAVPVQEEAGSMIGKGGLTVKCFELLAKLVGLKHGWQLKYGVDTGPGENPPQRDRGGNFERQWDAEAAKSLLASTLSAFLVFPADVTVLVDTASRTSYEVLLDDMEPAPTVSLEVRKDVMLTGDDAVAEALTTIFKAVGRLHGRTLSVTYARRCAPPEPQPMRADGRFTKAEAA